MTVFAVISASVSMFLFAVFVLLGIFRFGILESYSSYAAAWHAYLYKEKDIYTWSVVTIISAILMLPPLLETGDDSMYQFLGFFAPVYLIVVGFTPEYDSIRRQYIIHVVGALLCALASVLWLTAVRRQFPIILISLAVFVALGLLTKTLKRCYVFWLEMAMFASVYVSLLIPGA